MCHLMMKLLKNPVSVVLMSCKKSNKSVGYCFVQGINWQLAQHKKAIVHQLTTMLSTSKNVLFLGHSPLLVLRQ